MACEVARIDIVPAARAAFEAAAARAVPLFAGAAGCGGMRLLRSHERDDRYWLLVEWDDVAAHEAFRRSAAFAEWRSLVGGCFAAAPVVEHGIGIGVATG